MKTNARGNKQRFRRKSKAQTPAAAPTLRPIILLSPEKEEAFLAAIANGGWHTTVLKALNLTWRVLSLHMTVVPDFRERYDEAVKMREQLMTILREEEADRRAIEGWDDPVFQGGIQVGVVRKYSDRLMELRLKAADPAKYAERHEYTGADGGPIVQQMVGGPPRPATIAEWEKQVGNAKALQRSENGK